MRKNLCLPLCPKMAKPNATPQGQRNYCIPRAAIFLCFGWPSADALCWLAVAGDRAGALRKFSPTSVVFVGTARVLRIRRLILTRLLNPEWTCLRSIKADIPAIIFKSTNDFWHADASVDVFSGRGGGDCSYHFQKAEQYLVFPYKSDDGRLMATSGSETRPVELAHAKLAVFTSDARSPVRGITLRLDAEHAAAYGSVAKTTTENR